MKELLRIKDFSVFYTDNIVDNVSFSLNKGDMIGLIGRNGCGKSTLARLANGLYGVSDGNIVFKDTDLTNENEATWRKFRQPMQMIFQDPYG